MRFNAFVVVTLFFGVWFTVLSAAAWTRGRRVAAAFIGLLAAVDLAFAFDALMR